MAREFEMPIILPLRPRTGKMLVEFGIEVPADVREIEPLGFMDFFEGGVECEAGPDRFWQGAGGVLYFGRAVPDDPREGGAARDVEVRANVIVGFELSGTKLSGFRVSGFQVSEF